LSVIGEIEDFSAELQRKTFPNRARLHQAEVIIVNTGTATDRARRVADDPKFLRLCEGGWVEGEVQRFARIQLAKWGNPIGFAAPRTLAAANSRPMINMNSREGKIVPYLVT
jgi:hypothetical protein